MRSKFFSALKILFFFGIGILLIWLVAHNLTEEQKQQIFKAFKEADYIWVFVSIVLGILSNISRAVRWKMLLAPLGYKPKLFNTFSAVMIGYLANLAIPRLGEVTRCGILTKYEGIPFTQSFGTVIAERIIDMLSLIILFFVTIFLEYEKIYSYASEKVFIPLEKKFADGNTLFYAIIFVTLVVFVFIWLSKRKQGTPAIFTKLMVFLNSFLDGIKSIKDISSPILFIFHSIFIWVMYYLMIYVCFFCFPETSELPASSAFVLLVFGSVAVILTPGGIGVYQLIVAEVLALYLVSLPIGYAFGWIAWLNQVLLVVTAALVSLVVLGIKNPKVKEEQV